MRLPGDFPTTQTENAGKTTEPSRKILRCMILIPINAGASSLLTHCVHLSPCSKFNLFNWNMSDSNSMLSFWQFWNMWIFEAQLGNILLGHAGSLNLLPSFLHWIMIRLMRRWYCDVMQDIWRSGSSKHLQEKHLKHLVGYLIWILRQWKHPTALFCCATWSKP